MLFDSDREMISSDRLITRACAVIDALEICFNNDAAFTQSLDFKTIRAALLADGSVKQSDQFNIHALHNAIAAFREDVACARAAQLDPRRYVRRMNESDRRQLACCDGPEAE